MDWFLYDIGLRQERVKFEFGDNPLTIPQNNLTSSLSNTTALQDRGGVSKNSFPGNFRKLQVKRLYKNPFVFKMKANNSTKVD